jgi:hypothetical protein
MVLIGTLQLRKASLRLSTSVTQKGHHVVDHSIRFPSDPGTIYTATSSVRIQTPTVSLLPSEDTIDRDYDIKSQKILYAVDTNSRYPTLAPNVLTQDWIYTMLTTVFLVCVQFIFMFIRYYFKVYFVLTGQTAVRDETCENVLLDTTVPVQTLLPCIEYCQSVRVQDPEGALTIN